MKERLILGAMLLVLGCFSGPARAGGTWDAGGGADANWTTPANWDEDTLPAFDGTDEIVFSTIAAAGTNTVLDGDKSIGTLRSTHSAGHWSINGDKLTVNGGLIVKSGQSRISFNNELEMGADTVFQTDNNTGEGMLLAGQLSETMPGMRLIKSGAFDFRINTTNNTYTGDTVIRRGLLTILTNTPAFGPGPLGNTTNAVKLGDADTGANDWPVTLFVPAGRSFGRPIDVVDTGSSVKPIVNFGGSAGVRTGTITLYRDAALQYGQPGNGEFAGLITGVGGIERTGGGEILTLSNPSNDFSGDVRVTAGPVYFALMGTSNALGVATSDVRIGTGSSVARGCVARGSGVFSRNVVLESGVPRGQAVSLGNNLGGTRAVFSGSVWLDTPEAVVLTCTGNATSEFTGVISGTSSPIRVSGHASVGNAVILANTNNSFSGEMVIQNGVLFLLGHAPKGANGTLGNATSAVNMNGQTSGGNAPGLFTDGPFTVGRDLVVPATGYSGEIYIGGASADESVFAGDLYNDRTNPVGARVTLTATPGGVARFTGQVSGPGAWTLGKSAFMSTTMGTGGDVEFTHPSNDFSGDILISKGALRVGATGALGAAAGITVGHTGSTGFRLGVLTTGPVTVTNDLVLGTHVNVNGSIFFGGLSAHESTFDGNIEFYRPNGATLNYLTATNDGVAHFNGTLTGANSTLRKVGPGRVNLNGACLTPTLQVLEGELGGIGTITSVVSVAGGALSPGAPGGTLTCSNSVTFGANSRFLVSFGPGGPGQLEVHGPLSLAGATDTIEAPHKGCTDAVIVRYHDTLTGVFNITNLPAGSTVDYGTGFDSAITLSIPFPPLPGTLMVVR